MNNTCKDCKYYLPVDVFKGICKISKKPITPETAFCLKAEKVAKCKYCKNYKSEKEYLGKCMDTSIAYPDMIAAKCADFTWINQN